MHPILDRILKQRKIESVHDLHSEEKETFDRWNKILSDGDMSLDKVVEFCDAQMKLIDEKWKSFDNSVDKNERLIVCRTVYKAIRDLITSPRAEKENLEKYLNSLIN